MQDFAKQFVLELYRSELKPRGFSKRNHTFSRDRGEYVERVQTQGSSWNSPTDATWRFYVNAGVQFVDLAPPVTNRGLPGTHVYGRLAQFADGCEDSFELTAENMSATRVAVFQSIELASGAIASQLDQIRDAARRGRMMWVRDSPGE